MTVSKVLIVDENIPAFYIHNEDYTYNLFVDINGNCRQTCYYKYIEDDSLKI